MITEDGVLWFSWGLLMTGFVIYMVSSLVGKPQRVAAPKAMLAAACLMFVGFAGSLAVSVLAEDRGGVLRWGSALVVFLVVVLVMRSRHVRATQPG